MHIIVYRYGNVKFFWGSTLYMYNACPMGLCTSLRRNGHQSVIIVDDTYLQGETVDACNQNVMAIFLM